MNQLVVYFVISSRDLVNVLSQHVGAQGVKINPNGQTMNLEKKIRLTSYIHLHLIS